MDTKKKTKIDPLSKLGAKYKTDKCPQIKHPFTPFYFELLQDKRESIKKVLEIGIGYGEMAYKWRSYHTGASLLMWRDFFPNAQIYGVDIHPDALLNSERITSFICDQSKKQDLLDLINKIGTDIDLIIDDGSHKGWDQILTCKTLKPLVKKDVIYIIEDVHNPRTISKKLDEYDCFIPYLRKKFLDDNVIVVRNNN